jgi:hypothetical protein
MKTATEISKILECSPWDIGVIAHRQKWKLIQVRVKGPYNKVIFKYDVNEDELKKYKIDNVPMPLYRMTYADINSDVQKGFFLHLGVMDIPKHWYHLNDKASKVRVDVTSQANVIFKPVVRRYMRADTDTKIAMMNKIKHLITNMGIIKTVDLFRSMTETNEIVEVEPGKTMARNTFYMYANQARRELLKNGN